MQKLIVIAAILAAVGCQNAKSMQRGEVERRAEVEQGEQEPAQPQGQMDMEQERQAEERRQQQMDMERDQATQPESEGTGELARASKELESQNLAMAEEKTKFMDLADARLDALDIKASKIMEDAKTSTHPERESVSSGLGRLRTDITAYKTHMSSTIQSATAENWSSVKKKIVDDVDQLDDMLDRFDQMI